MTNRAAFLCGVAFILVILLGSLFVFRWITAPAPPAVETVKSWDIKPIHKIHVTSCGVDRDQSVTVDVVRIEGKTYHLFWQDKWHLMAVQPETTIVGVAPEKTQDEGNAR